MKDAVKEDYDYEWRLANAEKRLDESVSICNQDKETIRRFVRKNQAVLKERNHSLDAPSQARIRRGLRWDS
jgi:hypothetical protein